MITKETISQQHYIDIIGHASSMLNLSLFQIKEKYADYPMRLMEYIEKEEHEEGIEIRFDKEEVTITCIGNDNKECISVFFFPDDNQFIEDVVGYLKEHYDYSYLKSRFILDNCFMKIKEDKELKDNIYLLLYK